MFEKFVETISNTGKAVGEKTKIGTDIVKANLKISTEERALCELYQNIGEMYYKNNTDSPCCDDMKALFDEVTAKIAEIDELKAQVRRIKGVVACTSCGAEVDAENDFCGKCGAKLEKPQPAPEAVEETACECGECECGCSCEEETKAEDEAASEE